MSFQALRLTPPLLLAALTAALAGCGTARPATTAASQNPATVASQAVAVVRPVSGRTYTLLNTCAGKALDVSGLGMADGTGVITWEGNGGKNQQWTFEGTGDGFYKLTAGHSGKVLEVSGGEAGNGSRVQQWQYAGLAHQQWKVIDLGGGVVSLAPRHAPDSRLDVYNSLGAGGTPVHLWRAADVCAQRWTLRPVAEAARTEAAPGELQYSGPLVITDSTPPTRWVDGVRHFSGNWESLDPDQPAVTVLTGGEIVIENCNVRSRGHGILSQGNGTRLTVRHCRGYGLNPNTDPGVRKRAPGRFVAAEFFDTLIVENNELEGNGGIYANGDRRGDTRVIRIRFNVAKNLDGRYSDGAGGWLPSTGIPGDPNEKNYDMAQFVQINKVKDIPEAEIAWNRVENEPGQSRVEDNINIHESSGVPGRPIRIHDNLIRGAYAYPPTAPYTGGGIVLGDGCIPMGTNAYQEAFDNTVLNTSNYGMAVSHGKNLTIRNNTVLGSGQYRAPDGTLGPRPDAGIYLRDYCVRVVEKPGAPPQYISGHNHDPNTVAAHHNRVGWDSASHAGARPDVSVGQTRFEEDGDLVDAGRAYANEIAGDPGSEIDAAVRAWEDRVRANDIVIGPQ